MTCGGRSRRIGRHRLRHDLAAQIDGAAESVDRSHLDQRRRNPARRHGIRVEGPRVDCKFRCPALRQRRRGEAGKGKGRRHQAHGSHPVMPRGRFQLGFKALGSQHERVLVQLASIPGNAKTLPATRADRVSALFEAQGDKSDLLETTNLEFSYYHSRPLDYST